MTSNECLSFNVRAPGKFAVSLSELPMRNEASLRLQIGVHETSFEMWDPQASQWSKQWATTSKEAAAMGSEMLMGRYWVCMQETTDAASPPNSTFYFGSRGNLVLKKNIVLKSQDSDSEPFRPRYFAFSCESHEGYFSDVKVHTFENFEKYRKYLKAMVRAEGMKSSQVCNIANCKGDVSSVVACFCLSDFLSRRISLTARHPAVLSDNEGTTASTCRCKDCDDGFLKVEGDGMWISKC